MKTLQLTIISIVLISWGCAPKTSEAYKQSLVEHRAEYKADFKKNERAPLRTKDELDLMDFYGADASYICECSVTIESTLKPFDMATYSGMTKQFVTYARASCNLYGKKINLALYQNASTANHPLYGKSLFLPFKDHTNDESTYGGGRYIDIHKDSIHNKILTIDFNHCYNPWCAYSDGYNCPVPPRENHLDMAIKAGEKMYKGEKKH